MNTHSLFGYLFIALFSLLVVSCYSTPDGVMSSLSQAEKIMESRPDSAMLFCNISQLRKLFMVKRRRTIAY